MQWVKIKDMHTATLNMSSNVDVEIWSALFKIVAILHLSKNKFLSHKPSTWVSCETGLYRWLLVWATLLWRGWTVCHIAYITIAAFEHMFQASCFGQSHSSLRRRNVINTWTNLQSRFSIYRHCRNGLALKRTDLNNWIYTGSFYRTGLSLWIRNHLLNLSDKFHETCHDSNFVNAAVKKCSSSVLEGPVYESQ